MNLRSVNSFPHIALAQCEYFTLSFDAAVEVSLPRQVKTVLHINQLIMPGN